jgi:hypothetical protein
MEQKKLMVLYSFDEDERDHEVHLIVSNDKFKNSKQEVIDAISDLFEPSDDEDEEELRECIVDLMKGESGYYGIEYYWKEITAII